MKLQPSTKIHNLIETYPFLLDFLVGLNPAYELLKKTAVKATMGRFATLSMAASMGGITVDELIDAIAAEIKAKTGETLKIETADGAATDREKR